MVEGVGKQMYTKFSMLCPSSYSIGKHTNTSIHIAYGHKDIHSSLDYARHKSEGVKLTVIEVGFSVSISRVALRRVSGMAVPRTSRMMSIPTTALMINRRIQSLIACA